MNLLKLARKNKNVNPKSWERFYESEVIRRIRKKYTVNQEFAILRQRDTKPEEWEVYNAYCEECKRVVKTEFGIE